MALAIKALVKLSAGPGRVSEGQPKRLAICHAALCHFPNLGRDSGSFIKNVKRR